MSRTVENMRFLSEPHKIGFNPHHSHYFEVRNQFLQWNRFRTSIRFSNMTLKIGYSFLLLLFSIQLGYGKKSLALLFVPLIITPRFGVDIVGRID